MMVTAWAGVRGSLVIFPSDSIVAIWVGEIGTFLEMRIAALLLAISRFSDAGGA
jgi:hypothetical protein